MSSHTDTLKFKIFDASDYRVGIVAGQFNRTACEDLVQSAHKTLNEYQVSDNNIDTFRVAGSVEIPVVLKKLADTGKYDALIAIGVIIRGATVHFDYVAKVATEGVMDVQMEYTLPIGFAVLMLENESQLADRIRVGGDAAEAALQSAKIIKAVKD